MNEKQAADDHSAEASRLELERKRLECDKLRVDINQASLAWWKRPGYVGSMVPIVLAIVGLVSAWVSGFFNRERQMLKQEIEQLQAKKQVVEEQVGDAAEKRDEALSKAKQAQRMIDDAYLKILMQNANARYALSHIKPEGNDAWVSKEDLNKVRSLMANTPADKRESLNNLVNQYEAATYVVDAAQDSLADINRVLTALPASDRARRLEQQPPPNERTFLDPKTGKTYSPDELGKFLDEAE